jgi:hypothetical protein
VEFDYDEVEGAYDEEYEDDEEEEDFEEGAH